MFSKRMVSGWLLLSIVGGIASGAETWVTYEPAEEMRRDKQIVLLAGDEEYRSEEGLPMLARILAERHGFRSTVLFSVQEDGTINPDRQESLSYPEALDSADAVVMLLRFRNWPDEAMEPFVRAFRRGVPIVALRTSTHAFRLDESSGYRDFNEFGKRVLGENWVSHWGRHKAEATRGVIEAGAEAHPVLRGVRDVFGNSDVYEAYPPGDATILMRGRVLAGMRPDDPPAEYVKRRSSDGAEQDVNDPMMPVAWTREVINEAGETNRILTTTLGAATDLESEGLRRLIVNGLYWGLEMEVPREADVDYVGPYEPTMYGFGDYIRDVHPSSLKIEAEE